MHLVDQKNSASARVTERLDATRGVAALVSGEAASAYHPDGASLGSVFAGAVAVDNLGGLLSAVRSRLRTTVMIDAATAGAGMAGSNARLVQSSVLDCVSALDQIQVTLTREIERRNGLEQEIVDTRATLARTLLDLDGTRAGQRHALHRARHDSLTSLPNRAYFLERLDAELAIQAGGRQSLAILYLDLDKFKPINDRYGHEMGDQILRIVGVRLARSVRGDDMVCRLGGDEFACLLTDVRGFAQLGVLAGKLIDAISAPLQIGNRLLAIRPSVGISVTPDHGNRSEELMRHADLAMYHAKRHGTGFAFHHPSRPTPV